MRIVFIGRDNCFNRKYVSKLAEEHEILCSLFVEPDRFSVKARLKKIMARMKKHGLVRALDELLYHAYYRAFHQPANYRLYGTKPGFFFDSRELDCPVYKVDNIHDPKWINFIRIHSPDIIFSLCCHVIFRPELYELPRLGTYVLHEGLTPEYRGLHTTLWALLKKDYHLIGYTLLRINDQIDCGDVLLQNRYELQAGESFRTWGWVGHNALIEGLNEVKQSLRKLEQHGGFTPVDTTGRESRYYSWMRLSKFYSLYRKHGKAGRSEQ